MGEFPDPPDIRTVLEYYGIRTTRRMTLCPFHEDTVPSFSVDYNRGLYNCHACGESGNTWRLIMRKEGLDFTGAQRFATASDWVAEGGDEDGGAEISGSTYGRARKVHPRKRNSRGNRKFVPSWRSGRS